MKPPDGLLGLIILSEVMILIRLVIEPAVTSPSKKILVADFGLDSLLQLKTIGGVRSPESPLFNIFYYQYNCC